MTAVKKQYTRIAVDAVTVDRRIQRPLNISRVKHIARNFDPRSLGVLTLSLRPDGSVVVLDGQHRWAAAKAINYTDKLPALTYEGLSIEEEAALFLTQNDAKPVSTLDKFLVRITEGDDVAVAIARVVTAHGWVIQPGQTYGSIASVAALERAYNGAGVSAGPRLDVVGRVLETITEAWGHDPKAANGTIIGGLALLFLRFEYEVRSDKLIPSLQKTTPLNVVGKARAIADGRGYTAPAAVALHIHTLYNNGLRSRKLPNWTWTR